jgi:hypothetical protein
MKYTSVRSGIEAVSVAWQPNSMAVPVMRWIGARIAAVHEIVSRRVS